MILPPTQSSVINLEKNDVLLPRAYNKCLPSNDYYTIHNVNYMNDNLGKQQAAEYFSIPIDEQKSYMIKFVENFIRGKTFYKFNKFIEQSHIVDDLSLNECITKRIKNINSDVKYKARKYDTGAARVMQASSFQSTKYLAKKNYTLSKKVYKNALIEKYNNSWNMYSMFHTLYQSFSI